jgi:predicted HicB family RNase H-like nuclease
VSTLKYKDYQGSVAFEDGQLVIQILHIDDFVTTECDSASEAQQAFEALVDDYLETCKALEKEPSKPFKGSFNVRVSPNLHRMIAMAAIDSNETMNAWIAKALEEKVDRQRAAKRISDPLYITRLTERTPSHYSLAPSRASSRAPTTGDTSVAFARMFSEQLEEETPPIVRWTGTKHQNRSSN